VDTTDKGEGEYLLPEAVRGIAALRRIAQVTGGEYLGHVDASEQHFEKIQTLTAAYYVLGYPIAETWDGKYHKIKVEVKRPGLEVRAQAGYLNPKPFGEFTKIEQELHLVDLALSEKPLGQAPLRFSLAPMLTGVGQDGGLCLVADLPLRQMREKWTGGLIEVLGLVYDKNDEIVARTRSEERLATTKEDAAYLAAWQSVPPGSYRCRVVVRDLDTGAAAVGTASISIPEAAPAVRIMPPLFLKPGRGGRYLYQGAPKGAGKSAGEGALSTDLLFDASQYVPYFEAKLGKGTEAWAVIPCEGPEGLGESLKLSARLLDKLNGNEIALPLAVVRKIEKKGVGIFLVRLEIPDVEPDEYGLVITAEGLGLPSSIAKDFIIE